MDDSSDLLSSLSPLGATYTDDYTPNQHPNPSTHHRQIKFLPSSYITVGVISTPDPLGAIFELYPNCSRSLGTKMVY